MAKVGCNPITGRFEDYYCRKCIELGEKKDGEVLIEQPFCWDEPIDPNVKVTKPCTVCAMRMGGSWTDCGDANGVLPGRCAISSLVSSEHRDGWLDFKWMEEALDHQVVLGFVQFALYNHLKWSDIIDLEEGKSKGRPKCSPEQYRIPEGFEDIHQYELNWYWWKIIPHGTKLPKRLVNILRQILEKFPMMELVCWDGNRFWVPKNEQNQQNLNHVPSWGDFWNTFVEPRHVAFIFSECLEEVLNNPERYEEDTLETFNLGIPADDASVSHDVTFGYDEVPWEICQCVEWGGDYHDQTMPDTYEPKCYKFNGKYLDINERHVFGCTIQEVINYDSDFRDITNLTRNSFIKVIAEAEDEDNWRQVLWKTRYLAYCNTDMKSFWKLPHYYLVFNDRNNWRPNNLDGVLSDHALEDEFNSRSEDYDNMNSGGYTFSDEGLPEDDEDSGTLQEKKDKLKEIMELIEELKEKEKMNEGEYLEITNKMKEMFELL
jgi:hypothetical protein